MKRTIWDDLVEIGIGVAAFVGVMTIANALSNPQSASPQHRQYTVGDLRAETKAGFGLVNNEVQQLRDRVSVLERENARLRPFADFIESRQREMEKQNKLPLPKPKPHLWR